MPMARILSLLLLLCFAQQTPPLPQHHPLLDEYRAEWQ